MTFLTIFCSTTNRIVIWENILPGNSCTQELQLIAFLKKSLARCPTGTLADCSTGVFGSLYCFTAQILVVN